MIVGVCGPAGAGKSLLASHLEGAHGFTVVSIAGLPKSFVKAAFGFTDEQLYGNSASRSEPHPTVLRADGQPLTARYALQKLADWARDCSPDVWIDRALAVSKRRKNIVLPDVRYKNEVAAIKRAGGIVIRRKMEKPAMDMHASECDLLGMPDTEFAATLPRFDRKEQLFEVLDVLVFGWRSEAGQ